jgi:hypothetical protein
MNIEQPTSNSERPRRGLRGVPSTSGAECSAFDVSRFEQPKGLPAISRGSSAAAPPVNAPMRRAPRRHGGTGLFRSSGALPFGDLAHSSRCGLLSYAPPALEIWHYPQTYSSWENYNETSGTIGIERGYFDWMREGGGDATGICYAATNTSCVYQWRHKLSVGCRKGVERHDAHNRAKRVRHRANR